MTARSIEASDKNSWCEMRNLLWHEETERNVLEPIEFLKGNSRQITEVLVAELGNELTGFVELSIRNYAQGSSSFSVPYVEAWFVKDECRGRKVGSSLMVETEKWALKQGYDELASDSDADNPSSILKHISLGFCETVSTVHFINGLNR